mmetsp:Transcript_6362/g.14956  ORF Transcript_6362/g.14956 Transcript_6362/m.14956 type:complete len:471 (+) Transcript_6362:410-1822(+)
MQLEAQSDEHPVLIAKVREEGLAAANVAHILHGEGIQRLCIHFHLLLLIRFLLLLLLLILLLSFLFGLLLFLLLVFLLICSTLLLRLLLGLVYLLPLCGQPSAIGVLVLLLFSLPETQDSVPLRVLAPEPVGRLQILHPLHQLSVQDPLLEVLLALGGLVPHVQQLVAAFLLAGQAELLVGGRHLLGCQVRNFLLSEPALLLILREFHLHLHGAVLLLDFLILFFLFRLFFLFILLLLGFLFWLHTFFLSFSFLVLPSFAVVLCRFSLLFILLTLFGSFLLQLFADSLSLLSSRFRCSLLRLLLQHGLLNEDLVVFRRLPHDHSHHLLVAVPGKARQGTGALLCQQVVPHLGDDKVPREHGGHSPDDLANAVVLHERQSEAHLRAVIGPPPEVPSGALQATFHGPVQDGTVAQLGVVLVLGQELIHPIEGALVWQTHWQHHLVFAILGLRRRLRLGVRFGCLRPSVALER